MSNPFNRLRDEDLRGRLVRVFDVDGREYEGWAHKWDHRDDHLVLQDAARILSDGRRTVGTTFIAHPRVVESADQEALNETTIERVDLEHIIANSFAVREYDRESNREYIRQVADRDFVGSFPVVRAIVGGYEVVEGNKRLWVAKVAGLEQHPVRIEGGVSEEDAARRFVRDHFPSSEEIAGDGDPADGWYDYDEVTASLKLLVDELGSDVLSWPEVAETIEAFGVGVLPEECGTDFDWLDTAAESGEVSVDG